MTFDHLLSRGRISRPGPGLTADEAPGRATREGGGALTEVGGAESVVGVAEEGGDKGEEIDAEFPRLLDDSAERADDLTLDSPGLAHHHNYHGNEAGLELGL